MAENIVLNPPTRPSARCAYCNGCRNSEKSCGGCGATELKADKGWFTNDVAEALELGYRLHASAREEALRRMKKPESEGWLGWFIGSTESTGPR